MQALIMSRSKLHFPYSLLLYAFVASQATKKGFSVAYYDDENCSYYDNPKHEKSRRAAAIAADAEY